MSNLETEYKNAKELYEKHKRITDSNQPKNKKPKKEDYVTQNSNGENVFLQDQYQQAFQEWQNGILVAEAHEDVVASSLNSMMMLKEKIEYEQNLNKKY